MAGQAHTRRGDEKGERNGGHDMEQTDWGMQGRSDGGTDRTDFGRHASEALDRLAMTDTYRKRRGTSSKRGTERGRAAGTR